MSSPFNPPYRYEVSTHGPATVYDSLGVGWIARVKESLPHKGEIAVVITDALNRHASMDSMVLTGDWRMLELAIMRLADGETDDSTVEIEASALRMLSRLKEDFVAAKVAAV